MMKKETLNASIVVVLLLLCVSFKPNEAIRHFNGEIEEAWMKTAHLLLSSLPHGSGNPPGNGCNWTGNGGNPCVGSRKVGGVVVTTTAN